MRGGFAKQTRTPPAGAIETDPFSLFSRFFKKSSPSEQTTARASARVPAGTRVYAVGDVHGRSDLYDQVAEWVASDLASDSIPAVTIFLGDYVDRGRDSSGVLERLSSGAFPTEITTLSGNHEEMLLKFLDDESQLDSWRRYGGLETLHSYGVSVADVMRGQNFDVARDELAARLPNKHLDFLKNLSLTAEIGDYYFCHAGVRPGVALADQESADLLWIRGEFLNHPDSFGKRVVHGHTPVEKPELRANRINIDTGAFVTGALTCVALDDDRVRFFTTK